MEQGLESLKTRAMVAIVSSWAMMAATGAFFLLEMAEVLDMVDVSAMPEPIFSIYLFTAYGQTLLFFVSVVLVAMWIHRAHACLHELGYDGLTYTPGWAVGWFFIPIANLFFPFGAMRELWNASIGLSDNFAADSPMNLKIWWGSWIVGTIAGNISMHLGSVDDISLYRGAAAFGAFSSIMLMISAWYLIGIIRAVTKGQQAGYATAQVFE